MADARTGQRFPVHLPIKLLSGSELKQGKEGTTENISAAGVYLWVEETLEINSHVEFEITIPAPVIGTVGDVKLHCLGRVVRTDSPSHSKPGVACVIDEYEFIRPEQGS